MELPRPIVAQRHIYLPICPIWTCSWAKNLSNQAALGPDFAEPISLEPLDGSIWIWSSMELSRRVVVQHHAHLTLTLDFQGQILKMLYLKNWGLIDMERKGVWVERMLHPLCDFQRSPHPWPSPWIFKVKFWKSHISGMGWPIDIELKGCESRECWTHIVTFNVHLTHNHDFGFSRSNVENDVSQECDDWLTWNERDVSR